LRLSVIVLIAVLVIGGLVTSLGFLTNQKYVETPEISNQYEKLETYKNGLEKINQYNQQVLQDLEEKIKNSDNANLEKINEEIAVMRKVIDENAVELEQVITKLSRMKSDP
jgi:N12 class adenine-specific DNA methylase